MADPATTPYTEPQIDEAFRNLMAGQYWLNPPDLQTFDAVIIARDQIVVEAHIPTIQQAEVVEFPTPSIDVGHEARQPGQAPGPHVPGARPVAAEEAEPMPSAEVPIPVIIGGLALLGGAALATTVAVGVAVYYSQKRS